MEEIDKLEGRFIGLWKYQGYVTGARYTVTLIYKDKHWDTNTYKRPERALKEAVKLLNKLKSKNKIK